MVKMLNKFISSYCEDTVQESFKFLIYAVKYTRIVRLD